MGLESIFLMIREHLGIDGDVEHKLMMWVRTSRMKGRTILTKVIGNYSNLTSLDVIEEITPAISDKVTFLKEKLRLESDESLARS